MKKVKGLRENQTSETDKSMVFTRGKGGQGEVGEGNGRINGDGKRHDLGW